MLSHSPLSCVVAYLDEFSRWKLDLTNGQKHVCLSEVHQVRRGHLFLPEVITAGDNSEYTSDITFYDASFLSTVQPD